LSPPETDPRLRAWLEALVSTPGLTSVREVAEARRVHAQQSLAAAEHVGRFPGPIVDVGSGGGAPGIPLAAAFPDRRVTLLEAIRRKCAFLERWAQEFPNAEVVCGRAEDQAPDSFGVAVAKALAPPPVAAEWCLALVAPGGAAILLVGPSANVERVAAVAEKLGGATPEVHPGLLVIPKVEPTPEGFPRRAGMARKRPLA
jgi:16S rRNA (guanine527-N7)-methyltransferase